MHKFLPAEFILRKFYPIEIFFLLGAKRTVQTILCKIIEIIAYRARS